MSRTGIFTQSRQSRVAFMTTGFAKLSTIVLVALVGIGLLALLGGTRIVKSRASVTVQAVGRGKPYFNFQDGRELQVAYRGNENLTTALRSGQAQPRSLASIDLDRDGTPDVISGFAYNGMGLLTIQHGNPDAFAPRDQSVYARMQQGYNPEPLLPTADVYSVPVAADFLQVGDFNHDNQRDILVGAGGGQMFLLAGDGRGGFGAPEQIALPGVITSLNTGEFRAPDGWTDVAVGVVGPTGPELLIYDGLDGVTGEPMHLRLSAPATAVEFGEVDSTPFKGVAVATGNQVEVIHGWGRKQSPAPTLQSRVELVPGGGNVRGLAIGSYVWSREGTAQIATLGDDGTLHILTRGPLSTQPFTDEEIEVRARSRQNLRKSNIDLETVASWQAGTAEQWSTARDIVTGNVVGDSANAQNLLQRSHISFVGTDDLLVLGTNQQKLDIVRQTDTTAGPQTNSLKAAGDMVTTSLNTTAAPVTTLALPQKLNGERSLLVMQAGSTAPTVVPLAPTATITVDRTDDPNGGSLAAASVCGVGGGDCSLRGAVQFANANPGTTINLGTNTYLLNTSGTGGCAGPENSATGNTIGDLEINKTTTLTGTGSANTIIRQGTATNDRVICMDVPLTAGLSFIFSGMTITGGRDTSINGGGGFLGGALNAITNLTDVTFANNQSTSNNASGGGALITGGSMTVTNCTFGAANNPGANRNDLTLANAANTNSGGGLAYTSGDPGGTSNAVGTLTMTGTTFTHNQAGGIGGGGLDVYGLNLSTPTVNVSTGTFTSNQGIAAATSGGGMINEAANVTIATTSFSSNSVLNRGGALYVGGGTTLLDGTNPSLTFAGNNTAPNNPTSSSISTASALNVSGTNTTIGGSIEITLGGVWTTNTGTNVSPTDILIAGGTMNCNNSTMNITGNLTLGPSGNGLVGGTFNGNTGTVNLSGNLTTNTGGSGPSPSFTGGTNFNFVGAGNQSSGGTLSPTFVNLTVNKTNTLTLGVNSSVTGNLTVTAGTFDLQGFTVNRNAAGGTLTVSNGTLLKVGGTNPLPTNYSTHSIGSTSTIEYSGTTQPVSALNSAQNYGNLTISGSGTKTLQAATTVVGNLLISGGTLDVSLTNFALNVAGNFTNNVAAANFTPRAGTVTFNGSGPQSLNGNAASQSFNNFIVNKGGGTLTVGGSTTSLSLSGTMTLTAGGFDAGTATAIGLTTGDWTNNGGTFTPGTSVVSFTNTAGAQNINGTAATQTFSGITVAKTAQTLSVGGSTTTLGLNGSMLLTSGIFAAGTAANINVGGNWTNNGGTFTPGTGTVTFNGGGAQSLGGTAVTQTFNNFAVNKGGGTLSGVASTATLNVGAMTLTAGTFAAGTLTAINVSTGNWTNNGGVFTPGTSVVSFTNTAGAQNINGTNASQTFNSITVAKTAQTLSVGGSTTSLTLNGSLLLTSGTFAAGTATGIGVAGDWTNNGGTFTPGAGTVTFNGGGPQNLNGSAATQTFNNFTVSKGGGTLTGGGSTTTLTVGGNFTITAGTFAAGTITTLNDAGNWANGGTFTPGASNTVVFNGNNNTQTLTGTTSFTNLTSNHTGTGTVTASGSSLTVTGLMRVQSGTFTSSSTFNNVQIDSGTILASDGNTMNVSGNWTNNGGTFTPNGNTVNFNGGGAQAINGTSTSQPFNNLIVAKSGGTLTASITTLTTNDFTLTSGGFAGATLTDINGNIVLTAGTYTAGATTTVAGNWTNNGAAFTHNSGNVSFDGGAGQTISGTAATVFNNFTNADAGGIAMNNDNTVAGTLALGSTDITVANTKTLSQTSATASTGTGDVIGSVKRTSTASLGTTYTFGNPNNQITTTAGTAPTDITVNLVKAAPAGFAGAVLRTYTITPTAGSGITATLRLHYLLADLNSNVEASLILRRFNGVGWAPYSPTVPVDTVDHWVENNAVHNFSPWTFSSCCSPAAGDGVVSGTVTTPDGQPLAGTVINLSGDQARKTITDANGNYRFENVETGGFYTVTPTRSNYNFSPFHREFSQTGNQTDAVFTAGSLGDNVNPLDTAEYFVRQQYVDILGREPDEAGFNYWSDQILSCGADVSCTRAQRTGVAAAFFISAENQDTGSYLYDVYAGSLGRRPAFGEFTADRGQVVGGSSLDAAKTAFAKNFVQRGEFTAKYSGAMTAEAFVDALIQSAQSSGGDLSSERANLISLYGQAADQVTSRAAVLRSLADNAAFKQTQYNKAFVLTEYFSYLRRDVDQNGYDFWVGVLNGGGAGNYRGMVCSFTTSLEYQNRFSRITSHSNSECSGQ
jgi:predicted outer membrane repeat protein